MDASFLNADDAAARLKVSITTRLIGALVYMIPAVGAALSSLLMVKLFQSLRTSESAGVESVVTGMKEAALPMTGSLYLSAVCGIALLIALVVRMIVKTKTASPPFWFFVVGGILSLLPAFFFWKAQLLTLEAISPGSWVGSAGISGVATDISRLLLTSVVLAPVVFIALIVASVIPFTSRPGRKWGSLVSTVAVEAMLIAAAISVPFLIGGPKRQKEMVALPINVKNADSDGDIEKETSLVLTLTADDKLYQRSSRDAGARTERTEALIPNEELSAKIKSSMEDKTPDRRIVYLKCDANAAYEKVLHVLDTIRKADIDKVGLIVIGDAVNDPYQITPLRFQVHLPPPADRSNPPRPNPLTLVASLASDGRLKLNSEDKGTVSDPKPLENILRSVFKDRENNGVFREGSNEVEKTLLLKVEPSVKYNDFIKLVETVQGAGAQPVEILFEGAETLQIDHIDDLPPLRPVKK